MSEPRRHHLVPELHLKRFATTKGQVRVLHREDPSRKFVTSLENVPVERDFYAVETPDGRSQWVEKNLLGQIETDAAPAIGRLLGKSFPPNDDDRERISAFLALQHLRGWGSREQIRLIYEHMAKLNAVNITRAGVRQYCLEVEGRTPTEDEVDQVVAFASDPERYRIEIHSNELVHGTLRMLPGITNLVYGRKWRLMVFRRPLLLTSDAPVTTWSSPDASFPELRNGFGTADEICVALSRRHALVMTWDAPLGEVVRFGSDQAAIVINRRTAAHARRWIIHHPEDDPPGVRELPPVRPKIEMSAPFRVVPPGL